MVASATPGAPRTARSARAAAAPGAASPRRAVSSRVAAGTTTSAARAPGADTRRRSCAGEFLGTGPEGLDAQDLRQSTRVSAALAPPRYVNTRGHGRARLAQSVQSVVVFRHP